MLENLDFWSLLPDVHTRLIGTKKCVWDLSELWDDQFDEYGWRAQRDLVPVHITEFQQEQWLIETACNISSQLRNTKLILLSKWRGLSLLLFA
jgi:hypothetical protein